MVFFSSNVSGPLGNRATISDPQNTTQTNAAQTEDLAVLPLRTFAGRSEPFTLSVAQSGNNNALQAFAQFFQQFVTILSQRLNPVDTIGNPGNEAVIDDMQPDPPFGRLPTSPLVTSSGEALNRTELVDTAFSLLPTLNNLRPGTTQYAGLEQRFKATVALAYLEVTPQTQPLVDAVATGNLESPTAKAAMARLAQLVPPGFTIPTAEPDTFVLPGPGGSTNEFTQAFAKEEGIRLAGSLQTALQQNNVGAAHRISALMGAYQIMGNLPQTPVTQQMASLQLSLANTTPGSQQEAMIRRNLAALEDPAAASLPLQLVSPQDTLLRGQAALASQSFFTRAAGLEPESNEAQASLARGFTLQTIANHPWPNQSRAEITALIQQAQAPLTQNQTGTVPTTVDLTNPASVLALTPEQVTPAIRQEAATAAQELLIIVNGRPGKPEEGLEPDSPTAQSILASVAGLQILANEPWTANAKERYSLFTQLAQAEPQSPLANTLQAKIAYLQAQDTPVPANLPPTFALGNRQLNRQQVRTEMLQLMKQLSETETQGSTGQTLAAQIAARQIVVNEPSTPKNQQLVLLWSQLSRFEPESPRAQELQAQIASLQG